MGKKLFVGNLSFSVTEIHLTNLFSQCGSVESAKVIMDRDSGRSKGFAFVEMSSDAEAEASIAKFNETDFEGRNMKVNIATPMAPRNDRGGSSFGRRGNGGGGRDRAPGGFSRRY